MLVRKRILLAATATCAALVMPAVASAKDYCVGGPVGCSGTPVAAGGLKAALDVAEANGTDDRFVLAPGVYSADTFSYQSSERVQIIGAGAGETILRGSLANDAVLWLEGNPDSSVSSLAVQATSGMTAALVLQGTRAQDVDAGVYGAGFSGYGAALFGGATFDDGRVDIGSSSSYAVLVAYAGTVTGSTVHASSGVGVQAIAGTATVRRSTINAGIGAAADSSLLTIADSVISGGMIGAAADPGSGGIGTTGTVDLDRVTIVGGKIGAFAQADQAGENAAVHVRDSVISGVETPVARLANNGATAANVTTDRSAYSAPAQPIDIGPGTKVETRHLTVSPGFVDGAGGNFHLAAGSPLIDAGSPGGVAARAVDRDGQPRFSDGNGDCVRVNDIGAFEYQGTHVRAVAAAAAGRAVAGEAVRFSASGSCVAGPEAPTIRWSFDGGAPATGATVTHAFGAPGRHTAAVTVSDGHGHSARATAAVDITAPATGPRISRLRVSPTRVRIGSALTKLVNTPVKRPLATIRFRLSEHATVTLRFAKLTRSGRPRTLTTAVRIRARKGRTQIRFAGRLSRTIALTPGSYRLTAVATDTAGRRSKRARTRFTAVR